MASSMSVARTTERMGPNISSVGNERRADLLAVFDVADQLLAALIPDDRSHVRVFPIAGAKAEATGLVGQLLDKCVAQFPHADGHAAGQAPLAGVSEGRGDERGDRL